MTDSILKIIERKNLLFNTDISSLETELSQTVANSKFLVLGGAGSIGQSVVKEIFSRNPKTLHVIDISENNLVELVRDVRSSAGYIDGDFRTFAIDINSVEFDLFVFDSPGYDYILNLSALKHVRSEEDKYTLMRMIQTNIFNTINTVSQAKKLGAKKYFCVSTDKAANPVNIMGASKRIMEMFLMRESHNVSISTARFANVAFSDGSLLHGFNQRMIKRQPIVAPNDIKRYFLTPKESGELCLLSCIFGKNRDIFFPKLSEDLHLITFSEIAKNYLKEKGYSPIICSSEENARFAFKNLSSKNEWPCLFTSSNTTGEKDFEEFYTDNEIIDMETFKNIGIVKNDYYLDSNSLDYFEETILQMRSSKSWTKLDVVNLFKKTIPDFNHKETGKFLDGKM
jgi:FlaA1/EpsC-like NDP-sugar epimerase